ncbi:MAG: hypothetical protein IKH04_02255, partial [Kiritimatiellae bacterium]|nr:hypothetical protein [Kiritimatiellia bacterium]
MRRISMENCANEQTRIGGGVYSLLAAAVFTAGTSFAGLLYEPSNYAARGNLLLQLDGIRNVGMTKAHDSNAA